MASEGLGEEGWVVKEKGVKGAVEKAVVRVLVGSAVVTIHLEVLGQEEVNLAVLVAMRKVFVVVAMLLVGQGHQVAWQRKLGTGELAEYL